MEADYSGRLKDRKTLALRREQRLFLIRKNRQLAVQTTDSTVQSCKYQTPELVSFIDHLLNISFTSDHFTDLVQACYGDNIEQKLYGTIGIRKLITNSIQPNIQAIIDANLITKFIFFLKKRECPYLVLESAWCLCNVVGGTASQCWSVIDKGGIPEFIKLLDESDSEIVEKAIWAIGNIAGDCSHYRDIILRSGAVNKLVKIAMGSDKLISTSTWALTNLCRGVPNPKYELVQEAYQPICKIIMTQIKDIDILIDCSWALSFLSERKQKIKLIVDTGVVPFLIRLLDIDNLKLLIPTIRNIGNLLTGNEIITQHVLSFPLLSKLQYMYQHMESMVVKREICWLISNIAGTSSTQTIELIHRKSLFDKLFVLDYLKNDVKKETMWTIKNICMTGPCTQVIQFINHYKLIDLTLNEMHNTDNDSYILNLLEALNEMLQIQAKQEGSWWPFRQRVKQLNSIPLLQELQYHQSSQIYEKVSSLIQNFFQLENII